MIFLREGQHHRDEDGAAHQRVVDEVRAGAGDPVERRREWWMLWKRHGTEPCAAMCTVHSASIGDEGRPKNRTSQGSSAMAPATGDRQIFRRHRRRQHQERQDLDRQECVDRSADHVGVIADGTFPAFGFFGRTAPAARRSPPLRKDRAGTGRGRWPGRPSAVH